MKHLLAALVSCFFISTVVAQEYMANRGEVSFARTPSNGWPVVKGEVYDFVQVKFVNNTNRKITIAVSATNGFDMEAKKYQHDDVDPKGTSMGIDFKVPRGSLPTIVIQFKPAK